MLTTIAWQIDGKVTYVEGSVFIAGALVQWQDQLHMISSSRISGFG